MFPRLQRTCRRYNFSNPSCFRRERSCRVHPDTYGGSSILIFTQESENSAQQWMTLILGVNIPRGRTKRSMSSPSPNSLSIKKYDVPNIRNTYIVKISRGRTQNWISQPKLSFFFHLFSTRDSHRFRRQLQRGTLVCFFFTYFLTKISAGFFSKRTYTPALEQKKCAPLNCLVVL